MKQLSSHLTFTGDRMMRNGFPRFRTFVAALLAIVASAGVITAQVTERRGSMSLVEGRRYMVAFPKVWASPTELPLPQPMQLWISSKVKAKVRIETPAGINDAGRISREVVVEPNKTFKLPIDKAYMPVPEESERRLGYGIQVTADKPISVSTYQAWQGNGELARHIPVEAWGKTYYSMNFYQDRYGTGSPYKERPSQIVVIADKDQTVVTYTPTVGTQGGADAPPTPKGSSRTVTLERGEIFVISDKIISNQIKEFSTDLSGTFIRASKPVGIVSGHTKVAIMRYPDILPPTGGFAAEAHFVRNNVHDFVLPIEMAGTRFVTTPCMYTAARVTGLGAQEFGIDDDRGDVVRVVATEDNTTVRAMRQDGSGLLNKFLLRKKGDSYLETSLEVATYWETDKPVLMGQYGKSYAKILPPVFGVEGSKSKAPETPMGHPTVESGMPMFQYIPSVDRWVSYGVFNAPEQMDNFFNITFKTSEVSQIKFDGRRMNSVFGGAIKPIPGTEYSFIRTTIGAGDHVIESDNENVRWAAWNYGSYDGLQQGRAYGTPISIDLAIPCEDSLTVTEELVCGDVTGECKILPENTSCGAIFGIYAESVDNYELVLPETFVPGDKRTTFNVNVLDKTKDATATIMFVSRSGKWIEKTYTYIADKITWDPTSLNWGTIALATPVVKQMSITNASTDRPVTIKRLRVSRADVFKLNPEGPFTLGPGESRTIEITATIAAIDPIIDTVIAELECFEVKTTELRVRGEAPAIFVGDQEWVNVAASNVAGVLKDVEIVNGGKVELIVTDYDRNLLPATSDANSKKNYFFGPVGLNEALPLTLQAGERFKFQVRYSPLNEANVTHRVEVPFESNATGPDNIAILVGNGVESNVDAVIEPWNERVVDGVQTAQGITTYKKNFRFSNVGTEVVRFNGITIRNASAPVFNVIVSENNFGSFPVDAGAAQGELYVAVTFTPTEAAARAAERNDYKAEAVLNYTELKTGETKDLVVELNGTAWQPQVKGADHNFGTMDIAAPAVTTSITVSNDHYQDVVNPTDGTTKGTHSVKVIGLELIGANDGKIEILNPPSPAAPWILNPGESTTFDARFTPSLAGTGTFEVDYRIVTEQTTFGAASFDPTYKIRAAVTGGSFTPGTGSVDVWVNNSADITVPVNHDQATTKVFNIGLPAGPDAGSFSIVEPANGELTIAPGATGYIRVRFTPGKVSKLAPGQNAATLDQTKAGDLGGSFRATGAYTATIPVTDAANGETKDATVSGNGLFVETTNGIGTYTIAPGNYVDVAIELKNTPENISLGQVRGYRAYVNFDSTILRVSPSTPVVLAGTQAANWQIKNVDLSIRGQIILDLEADNTKEALNGDINLPLVKVRFEGFLGKGLDQNKPMTSPLTLYGFVYYTDLSNLAPGLTSPNFVYIHDIPGSITVDLKCANTKRLVSMSGTNYGVRPIAPNPVTSNAVINYSIGLDGLTRIVLFDALGNEVMTIVNERLSIGTYETTVDLSTLPTGTYYYRVISGPFTSDPFSITVVR